ncbi:hypothetical protein ACUHGC_07645 [Testudinibacter sp. P27/CKL/0425]
MEKSFEFSVSKVYERTGKTMDALMKAAPKMLIDERFLFKGSEEVHGKKKHLNNRNAA